VVTNYDPALNHGGMHSYVDDTWNINTQAGTNILRWQAGTLCSAYWIQMLEILPPSTPMFNGIQMLGSNILLQIKGAATNGGSLQASTNLLTWEDLIAVPAFTTNYSLTVTNNPFRSRRFFRLKLNP
jgi:hypothetical protein